MTQPANTLDDIPLVISIRPMPVDDLGFAVATFRETFKHSSAQLMRMGWPQYKLTYGPQLAGIVANARVLAAYAPDGHAVGWLAYTPGRSISAVHWTYTRERSKVDGNHYRRRGVMSALIDAAGLGKRFVFTHHGSRESTHHSKSGRSKDAQRTSARGPSLDVPIVEWLRGRGVHAEFIDWKEWNR